MLRKLLLCFALLFCSVSTHAQETNPVITPTNATQLTELRRIGGTLPGDLAWSPDGTKLAVGTSDGVSVYDTNDLSKAVSEFAGDTDVVFNATGDLVVSDRAVWDAGSGEQILDLGSFDSIHYSPSGNILATIFGSTVEIWDIKEHRSAKAVSSFDTNLAVQPHNVVFSPDDLYVALGFTVDETAMENAAAVQIWQLTQQQDTPFQFFYRYPLISSILFTGDNQYVVVANESNNIYGDFYGDLYVHTAGTGETAYRMEQVANPVINANGTRVGFERVYQGIGAILFDDSFYEPIYFVSEEPVGSEEPYPLLINPLFSPDGHTLALDNDGSQITLWDTNNPRTFAQKLNITGGAVGTIRFDMEGNRIFLSSSADKVHVFDTETGDEISSFEVQGAFTQLSPDGQLLVMSSEVASTVFNVNDKQRLLTVDSSRLALNPDWSYGAYWKDGEVEVVNLSDFSITSLGELATTTNQLIKFDSNAGIAVFMGEDLELRDIQTNEVVYYQPIGDKKLDVIFSQTGSYFAILEMPRTPTVGSTGISIRTHETPNIETNRVLLDAVVRVSFSNDGSLLAVIQAKPDNNSVSTQHLYDSRTGKALLSWEIIIGSSHAISLDNQLMATGGNNGIEIWDISDLAKSPKRVGHIRDSSYSLRDFNFNKQYLLVNTGGEIDMVGGYNLYLLPIEEVTQEVEFEDIRPDLVRFTAKYRYPVGISPDISLIAAIYPEIYDGGIFQISSITTGEIFASFDGSGAGVFNPDSSLLATSDKDSVHVWEVEQLLQGEVVPLVTFKAGDVVGLAFSANSTELYVSDSSGVSVWGIGE
jgi:WD40 repeat protein